ncbi:TonB-dependent receptor [Pseudoalteromonas luteoviolacea B = ATCC 29581]|nr:TonB-dependent receptor [Pseudoalteromonas luteoviolacea B = ATCC 29581]
MPLFRKLIGFASLFAIPSFANTPPADDLFELSFEELLDVNIELATKTDETRATVPSSITVFNKQHIKLLGVKNAYDLMNFVPGFQNTRGDWVGAVPKEHTRGIYLDSGNVLVMIDGQRINESSFGKASVYTPFIPVDVIERVEFIRGPGSALYGSNAFLGVMNVVTKNKVNEVTIGFGEHGFMQSTLNTHTTLEGGVTAYSNIAVVQQQGQTYFNGQVNDPLKNTFVQLGIKSEKFDAQYRQNSNELDGFINLAGISPNNQHRSENRLVSFTYRWMTDEQWQVSSRIYQINHQIDSAGLIAPASVLPAGDFFVGPSWRSRDINFTTDAAWKYSPDTTINVGIEVSRAKQTEADVRTTYFDFNIGNIDISQIAYLGKITTVTNYAQFEPLKQDFNSNAIYSQIKHQLNDNVTLFVGARYDEVKHIDEKLSPRLAAIYQFNAEHTFKIQYGESFRTPVSNELNSNDDVTIGNSQLSSEFIKTTELVWHWQTDKNQFDVVVFNNDLNDFITLVPIDSVGSRFRFENVYNTSMQGIELNGNFTLTDKGWFEFGYTQMFDETFNASFRRFAAAAWKQQWNDLQFSLNANWRDRVFVPAQNNSFNQDAYTIFGASLLWQPSTSYQWRIEAQNLTNKHYDVFDPRMPDGRVPSAGRQLRASFTYKF